jgi:hypothetical protein
MIIIRLPAEDLKYFDPRLIDREIIVSARYGTGGLHEITRKLEVNEKICHWAYFRSGKTLFIQFFDSSEVFGMSKVERKYLNRS